MPGSVTATRPYYGTVNNNILNKYNETLHAWVRQVQGQDKYYLQFEHQDQAPNNTGNPDYEPSNWLTPTPTAIEFNHELNNNYETSDFDYSPYTISFKIVHDDLIPRDPSQPIVETDLYKQYSRDITIIQYPAIYIEATRNRDQEIKSTGDSKRPYGYKRNGQWSFGPEEPWGYVYIDADRFVRVDKKTKAEGSEDPFWDLDQTSEANRQEYQWRTVWYTGGSRDLFKINVTVLPLNSQLVIGDPRVDDIDNLNYTFIQQHKDREPDRTLLPDRNGFSKAPTVNPDEDERPLMYYYPTDETSRTENMLAPSYRIASKFGGTEYGQGFFRDITQEFARYRCAAFQEDGFPAGRWRLPTKGEILFISQLSAKGAFDPLFSFGSTYWSANGAITVNRNGTVTNSTATKALLRCVYDSWYWGDDRLENPREFKWGDKER